MSQKKLVVKDDQVSGTDKHDVTIQVGNSPQSGTATYDWKGPVRAEKAPFFTIGGKAVATVDDKADLQSPHVLTAGTPSPAGTITAWVGSPSNDAHPASGAGSTFFKAGGAYVLLDSDKFSGCQGNDSNLTVAATADFFTVKE